MKTELKIFPTLSEKPDDCGGPLSKSSDQSQTKPTQEDLSSTPSGRIVRCLPRVDSHLVGEKVCLGQSLSEVSQILLAVRCNSA